MKPKNGEGTRRKRLPFRHFCLTAGTYDFDIVVVITEDEKRLVKFIREKFGDPNYAEATEKDEASVYYSENHCPILWLRYAPKTPREYGALVHEVFHVVCLIMKWASIPLNEGSEEPYAYLLDYLTTEILKRL